jgi:hypothetical protein
VIKLITVPVARRLYCGWSLLQSVLRHRMMFTPQQHRRIRENRCRASGDRLSISRDSGGTEGLYMWSRFTGSEVHMGYRISAVI